MPRKQNIRSIIKRSQGQRGIINLMTKKAKKHRQRGIVKIENDPKYFRIRSKAITSKALDAVGLNPKNKRDAQIRKEVHILIQEIVNLNYLFKIRSASERKFEKLKDENQNQIRHLISLAKGTKATAKFWEFYNHYSELIAKKIME